MTNSQYTKVLNCVKCGISISIAMKRLFGTSPSREQFTKEQYKQLRIYRLLRRANCLNTAVDYGFVAYYVNQIYVKNEKTDKTEST